MQLKSTFEIELDNIKAGPYNVELSLLFTKEVSECKINNLSKSITTIFPSAHIDHDELYKILAKYYQFGSIIFSSSQKIMEKTLDKLGNGVLVCYDNTGDIIEKWSLQSLWPQSVNFGDLDYSSKPDFDLTITWRFTNAVRI